MKQALTSLLVLGFLGTLSHAGEVKFNLSGDNTKVTFVGSKDAGKHDGGFKVLTGTASYNGKDPTTLQFDVDIDLTSIYTDTEKLTNHLKSPDFFDVKNYPKAKFVSAKVEKSGDEYKVTGKLTMHGKTKDVTFPAKIEAAADKLTLTSNFKINRHDWNVSYGKGIVHDNVSLTVKVTAKK